MSAGRSKQIARQHRPPAPRDGAGGGVPPKLGGSKQFRAPYVPAVGSLLPYTTLPAAPEGADTAMRSSGREATVLVRVHDATCRDCRRYLADLAVAGIDFAWWEGRVVVLVPGPLAGASALRADLGLPFTVLSDPEGEAPLANGAGVLVADRYGQVYYVSEAGGGHAFLAPRELEEWLKFLATQCPE